MKIIDLKYCYLILILILLSSCSSEKEDIQTEFKQLGISLNNDFIIIENNSLFSLTDYAKDIELVLDSINFNTVSNFIINQPNFFNGDSISDVNLFNKYPYSKGDLLFWETFKAKEPSYEYFRIEANTKTNRVKYHYLDEE